MEVCRRFLDLSDRDNVGSESALSMRCMLAGGEMHVSSSDSTQTSMQSLTGVMGVGGEEWSLVVVLGSEMIDVVGTCEDCCRVLVMGRSVERGTEGLVDGSVSDDVWLICRASSQVDATAPSVITRPRDFFEAICVRWTSLLHADVDAVGGCACNERVP